MAITRLAVSTPSADTDVLMHTAARAAVESVIITNKNTTSASISVWVVPYGEDANSDNWVYIASNVVVDAGNTMETFRFPAVAADKIYIRSNKTNVSFSLNALYEVNGTSNITVQSAAPESPQIGDVWVDSDDNFVYFWGGSSWVTASADLSPYKQEISLAIDETYATTLASGYRYFVDTSTSAVSLTMPATPSLGNEIQVFDASGNASTNNITLGRNGVKINGGTEDLLIDIDGGATALIYTGSTYGWKVA